MRTTILNEEKIALKHSSLDSQSKTSAALSLYLSLNVPVYAQSEWNIKQALVSIVDNEWPTALFRRNIQVTSKLNDNDHANSTRMTVDIIFLKLVYSEGVGLNRHNQSFLYQTKTKNEPEFTCENE